MEKIVSRIWKNSRLETVEETVRYWWSQLKTMEEKSYGDAFLTEDEIVDCLLERLGREECLEQNGLTAAGIISGEMVRAYKPHKEVFDYALKISGCTRVRCRRGDSYRGLCCIGCKWSVCGGHNACPYR